MLPYGPVERERYHLPIAAAFVRGRLGLLSDQEAVARGLAAGLRLHRYKRHPNLPRVERVLGVLRGFAPHSVLDVGSGRGTFLWPLLEAFPRIEVTAVEADPRRAEELLAVSQGGIQHLRVIHGNVERLLLEDHSVDIVTALEVLEHVADPTRAAREAVRVARRAVIATVPSGPDQNPEHLRVFGMNQLQRLWLDASATRVTVEGVRGHWVAVARLDGRSP